MTEQKGVSPGVVLRKQWFRLEIALDKHFPCTASVCVDNDQHHGQEGDIYLLAIEIPARGGPHTVSHF